MRIRLRVACEQRFAQPAHAKCELIVSRRVGQTANREELTLTISWVGLSLVFAFWFLLSDGAGGLVSLFEATHGRTDALKRTEWS